MFRIPIDTLNAESLCNISKQDQRAELLRVIDLIIWDKALMQSWFTHEALDRTMHNICDNKDEPFDGKTIIFGGDFQQTLPVVPRGLQEDVVFQSLLHSYLWHSMQVLTLHVNVCLLNRPLSSTLLNEECQFVEWLLSVGCGEGITNDGTIPFDPCMCVDMPENLITSIYPHIDQVIPPPQYFLDLVILAPWNTDVDHLNDSVLMKLPGNETVLYSTDSIKNKPGADDY